MKLPTRLRTLAMLGFVCLTQLVLAQMRQPREERPVGRLDLAVNRINFIHQNYPFFDGTGRVVSVKELHFDTTDLDLLGKNVYSRNAAPVISTHATTVASIISGHGNTFRSGRGVVPAARLSSASFLNLSPEQIDYYHESAISVQNHSYGVGIENFYGSEAKSYDSLIHQYPVIIHVFSAGNYGDSISAGGLYDGIEGFSNITGTMKMAKNVLVVGAVDSFMRIVDQSSRGPAYDGRIKPEIAAYGHDGASGAAAIVSGLAVLLQQAYATLNQGNLPSSDLLRAIMINTADDIGPPGPDYLSGYGNVNARRALLQILGGQFVVDKIGDETKMYEISVPSQVHKLRVTVSWTDPPASTGAEIALVNDLDLSLRKKGSEVFYYPWVLSSSPHADSLKAIARRASDHLNTQEQVTIHNPDSGTYVVAVTSRLGGVEDQSFALCYYFDTSGVFTFTSPASREALSWDQPFNIHWEYSGPADTFTLAYKSVDEEIWHTISDSISLAQGYWPWQARARTGLMQLRATIQDDMIISDTFVISPFIELKLGFDCDSNVLLEWPLVEEIAQYQLFELQGERMQPVATVSENFYLTRSKEGDFESYAVAPVVAPGFIGLRSVALQLRFQQVGCYEGSFIANLEGSEARLDFYLSTLFLVESLQLQKWDGTKWIAVWDWTIGGLEYEFYDGSLRKGSNIYRVRVGLQNGSFVYSQNAGVFFVPQGDLLIYPNPVNSGSVLNITLPEFEGRSIQIFDGMGRKVEDVLLLSPFEILGTNRWSRGIYLFVIRRHDGVIEHRDKLVVH